MWEDKYKRESGNVIPEGDYLFKIISAEMTKTKKTDKDMLKLELKVSNIGNIMYYYVVFDDSTPEKVSLTNRKLTAIFDAFGINDGDFVLANWVGKIGAGKIKTVTSDNYGDQSQIAYFISAKRAASMDLGIFKDTASSPSPAPAAATAAQSKPMLEPVNGNDLPF